MSFTRRILHHGPSPSGTPVLLSMQAVKKCWFELNRQGGCGSAELILSNSFEDRSQVELGDWISFEATPGDRWYLGRVEERSAASPIQTRLRLEGMSIELNEVFPGGFGVLADGRKPHRYAQTDLFSHDPDRHMETFDSVADATELIQKLIEQYVLPASHITLNPDLLESPLQTAVVSSLKLRGEESVRSLINELATRAQSSSWGVNEQGEFYFLRPGSTPLATYREGENLVSLSEIRDREHLFNRILLTGDYIYDRRENSEMIARRSFRWRSNFVEPISRAAHGERRIRIWLPWVRTQADSLSFAKEFFRTYAQPVNRYLIETIAQTTLPKPWEGRYALYDKSGELLTFAYAETVRVLFDHSPRLRMELGPLDPHELWAEPPQDERWELPDLELSAGGPVSLPPEISIDNPPQPPPGPPTASDPLLPPLESSEWNSSFNGSSLYSSGLSSAWESSGISSEELEEHSPGISENNPENSSLSIQSSTGATSAFSSEFLNSASDEVSSLEQPSSFDPNSTSAVVNSSSSVSASSEISESVPDSDSNSSDSNSLGSSSVTEQSHLDTSDQNSSDGSPGSESSQGLGNESQSNTASDSMTGASSDLHWDSNSSEFGSATELPATSTEESYFSSEEDLASLPPGGSSESYYSG